jgi:uncharacterized protein (DUF983 family)
MQDLTPLSDRPSRPAMLRGWRRRCPACGNAALFDRFLHVADTCPGCGEALHHHRADDGPAYLTILVTGKVVMAAYMPVFLMTDFSPWVMLAIFWTLAITLSLYLLPRFKGAIVGLQWARRMYGFGGDIAHPGARAR